MTLKEQILELRSQGLSYRQIAIQIPCSKGTICYYLADGQKDKTSVRQRKNRAKQHSYVKKIESFSNSTELVAKKQELHKANKILQLKVEGFSKKDGNMYQKPEFTVEDVINKFGDKPKCYLTGDQLDITKPREFHFDHIIPRTKGGDNSLANLGLCTKAANIAKNNLSNDEFLELCIKVVKNQGYELIKTPDSRLERETKC